MRLNLAIDRGNTSLKVSLFEGTRLVSSERNDSASIEEMLAQVPVKDITRVIYCTVVGDEDRHHARQVLGKVWSDVTILSSTTPLPIALHYATPATLGPDRIATAVGALAVSSAGKVVVADLGSALTIDVVSRRSGFEGGRIAPGVTMRLRALHEHTGALPLVEPQGEVEQVPQSTVTAIRSGVLLGMAGEIDSAMARHPRCELILTGGDASLIAPHMRAKHRINDNLLAIGLNKILMSIG